MEQQAHKAQGQDASYTHQQHMHDVPAVRMTCAHSDCVHGVTGPASICSSIASTYCTVSSLVTFFSTVRKASM